MNSSRRVPAIKVKQWLKAWDAFEYRAPRSRKPLPHFYVSSMPAVELRRLCGIQRRSVTGGKPRGEDIGIQRRHEPGRSHEISAFIASGHPWADLTPSQKADTSYDNLRKPGWLPTAIVVNILTPADDRYGAKVAQKDLVIVRDEGDLAHLVLPAGFDDSSWMPGDLPPLEVIDGQHRLWAVESGVPKDFDLPVVAFVGLDIAWQAYLFWTINIKPRRINPSLAFDLYPLLRTQDWVERFRGPNVYKETRAQELTEALWLHPESPWRGRINMLGEPGLSGVTQAAWIRSLLSSFVRTAQGPGIAIGGIFGAPAGSDDMVLPWSGSQQAAFLIELWRLLEESIAASALHWAMALRDQLVGYQKDAAFEGPHTLLNTDQGVRVVLNVANDLTEAAQRELQLLKWRDTGNTAASDVEAVSANLKSLRRQRVHGHLRSVAELLALFDWRTSTGAGLTGDERTTRLAYRGSGGYRELRRHVLRHIAGSSTALAPLALRVARRLKMELS